MSDRARKPNAIRRGVAATIGGTPLVELQTIRVPGVRLLAKLESRNPCGSVKDRIALAMIDDAEARGVLQAGGTIVEATSGNTGIALAFVAATRGYRLVVTMPERLSRERQALLRYLGAEVVLTPGALMADAVARAEALRASTPGAIALEQFRNPANPRVHEETTGPELWADAGGQVDCFVAGVGTGGTVTGVGAYLKRQRDDVRIVAVEPANAAVLSGRRAANHMIQGIGAGFVPPILRRDVIDEVLTVTEDEAFAHTRRLAREEGISAGVSSGANLAAALRVAARPENRGRTIAFMVCDTGERYIHGPLIDALAGS